jgi:Flp pilus assembly protein TadG
MRHRLGRWRRERGTAAVEFALVLPLVLVMALALVQIGLLVRDRLLLESAVRAGARAAALQPDDAAARAAVMRAAPSLDAAVVDVSVARDGTQGSPVTVAVAYVAAIRVPLVGWLFGTSVDMHAAATDRQEFG